MLLMLSYTVFIGAKQKQGMDEMGLIVDMKFVLNAIDYMVKQSEVCHGFFNLYAKNSRGVYGFMAETKAENLKQAFKNFRDKGYL